MVLARPLGLQAATLRSPMKVEPMRVERAVTPPPGLEPPSSFPAKAEDYRVGEEVFALRSNGAWSPATISQMTNEKITLVLSSGTKQVRTDQVHRLLKKVETPETAVVAEKMKLAELSLQEAVLANQKAVLEVENARLCQENLMMMQMQALNMANAQNARFVPAAEASMYAMQDPSMGYAYGWGVPEAEAETQKQGWFASKVMSKISGKKKNEKNEKNVIDAKLTASIASLDTSVGSSSLPSCPSSGQSSISLPTCPPSGTSCQSIGEDELGVQVAGTSPVPVHERTTVMMRNIPNNITREQLLSLINDEGFEGGYDLLYLPIDLKNKVGLGYSFINFVSNADAEAFANHFTGFTNWNMQSEKVCNVVWSDAMQGLQQHVERYRDCPVMHESIPDEFKPVLYKDGARVPFPEPTKKIRAPRPWSRRN